MQFTVVEGESCETQSQQEKDEDSKAIYSPTKGPGPHTRG
jgi:hypothetical protein